jgi:hypothetical protein
MSHCYIASVFCGIMGEMTIRQNTKRKAQDKLVEAILPVQMRVTTIADAEAKTVAPLLHPE